MIGLDDKQNKSFVVFAEQVTIAEESRSNPVFLAVDVKMCDSIKNRNKEGVTKEFIEDVIANEKIYNALPFYADKESLLNGRYLNLSHMYNKNERKFGTTQIGSVCDLRAESDENGVTSLYGTIRIPRREREICDRCIELYDRGLFAVSFEVSYNPEFTHKEGDAVFIDVGETNHLTGLCLVSVPACRDAVALDLVAEAIGEAEEATGERGETSMDNEQEVLAETEAVAEEAEAEVKPVEDAEDGGKQPVVPEADPEGGDDDEGGEDPEAGGGEGDEGGADANAEVVYHETSVETAYEAGCPECGCPPVVRTTMRETIVETVDEGGNDGGEANAEAEGGDDKDKRIAELEARVAELETIEAKYNALMAEAAEAENRKKCASAKAFAEKNGLDVNSEDVKNAIAELNFEKLAEMTMREEAVAETAEVAPTVKAAGYAEMDMAGNEYGGLLNRRSR